MKLSAQKLSVEDFKDQNSWINKLLNPLNQFISQVYAGFNNQITVGDNLYQEIKSVSFTAGTYPITFKTKFNKHPEMILVASCIDSTGVYSSVQPLIQWSFDSNIVSISNVSGLTASTKYTLKMLIIYA